MTAPNITTQFIRDRWTDMKESSVSPFEAFRTALTNTWNVAIQYTPAYEQAAFKIDDVRTELHAENEQLKEVNRKLQARLDSLILENPGAKVPHPDNPSAFYGKQWLAKKKEPPTLDLDGPETEWDRTQATIAIHHDRLENHRAELNAASKRLKILTARTAAHETLLTRLATFFPDGFLDPPAADTAERPDLEPIEPEHDTESGFAIPDRPISYYPTEAASALQPTLEPAFAVARDSASHQGPAIGGADPNGFGGDDYDPTVGLVGP